MHIKAELNAIRNRLVSERDGCWDGKMRWKNTNPQKAKEFQDRGSAIHRVIELIEKEMAC